MSSLRGTTVIMKHHAEALFRWLCFLPDLVHVKYLCSFCQRFLSIHKGPSDNAHRLIARLLYRHCQFCDTWHLYNITEVTAHSQDDQIAKKNAVQCSAQILNFSQYKRKQTNHRPSKTGHHSKELLLKKLNELLKQFTQDYYMLSIKSI